LRHLPLLVLLAGCASEGSTRLLVPDDAMRVPWDDSWDDTSDIVALVPIDVFAWDAATGAAVPDVELVFDGDGVGLVADSDLAPGLEYDCSSCVWDAWADTWLQDDLDPVESMALRTDSEGTARVYAWVSAFPTFGEPVGVWVRGAEHAELRVDVVGE